MDINTATEQAYRNGYEAGKRDAEPKWIPVTERFPDEEPTDCDGETHTASALVLVNVTDCDDKRFVSDDIRFDGEWVNFPFPEYEVTHWMHLPNPPTE